MQKLEITNKNTGKKHVKMASQAVCESRFQRCLVTTDVTVLQYKLLSKKVTATIIYCY